MREVLVKKEYLFVLGNKEEIYNQQAEIIKSLEILGLSYEILRTNAYITNTPTWEVTIYK